jgi:hypothetical protein
MAFHSYVYEHVSLHWIYNLNLKKKEKEVMMEVKEESEDDPLLLHFFPLKICQELVSFIPSNPRTKLSPSPT